MAETKTIKMTRETPAHEGGPTSADVEQALVPEWEAAGWTVAGRAASTPAAPASPAVAAAKADKAVVAKKTTKGAKK